MGSRSYWLHAIAQQTGDRLDDTADLQVMLKHRNIRAKTYTLENLEAIAYHLGCEYAQNISLELLPEKPPKPESTIKGYTNQDLAEMRKTMTVKAIADLLGVTRQAISDRLRKVRSHS